LHYLIFVVFFYDCVFVNHLLGTVYKGFYSWSRLFSVIKLITAKYHIVSLSYLSAISCLLRFFSIGESEDKCFFISSCTDSHSVLLVLKYTHTVWNILFASSSMVLVTGGVVSIPTLSLICLSQSSNASCGDAYHSSSCLPVM